jgi:cytochrome c biogenesis protein
MRCLLKENRAGGLFSFLEKSLSSLKFAIALLMVLAGASVVGTLIPQGAPPEEYLRIYSLPTYRILRILGFLDVYRSVWFMALLALLGLSILVCSVKRFRALIPFLFRYAPILEDSQWEQMASRRQFWLPAPLEEASQAMEKALSGNWGNLCRNRTPKEIQYFAERQKASRFGVLAIHFSILLILAGALIGSFWGFRGYIRIEEGQVIDRVILPSPKKLKPLGFAIRLNQFQVSFYPDGTPKEFKSIVSILEDGRAIFTESIRVNHPLTYQGISFYQTSYDLAPGTQIVLAIRESPSGKIHRIQSPLGERIEIPDGSGSFYVLTGFHPDLQGLGPAVQVMLFEPQRRHERFWIWQNLPESEEKPPGRYRFRVVELSPRYSSGLQATYDPGAWIVWAGCFLMVGGFFVVLFLSHRRIWGRLREEKGGTRVDLGGVSHRNRLAFEKELDRMERNLQALFPRGRTEEEIP